MNLYEISKDLAIIHDELAESGGELLDGLEARLDASTLAFRDKVEGIGKWIRNLAAREAGLKQELDRLTARKQAVDNLQKRLKEYVKQCMEIAGEKKLEYDSFTIAIQKNPPSVDIQNEGTLQGKYITIIPEQLVPDKKAIIADLKAGVEVEGCALTQGTHLRIR